MIDLIFSSESPRSMGFFAVFPRKTEDLPPNGDDIFDCTWQYLRPKPDDVGGRAKEPHTHILLDFLPPPKKKSETVNRFFRGAQCGFMDDGIWTPSEI